MSSALSKLESLREHSAGLARNAADVAGRAGLLASAGADYVTDATSVVDGSLRWNYQE
jgi:hypothetical protein